MKHTTLIVHLWLEPGAGTRASVRLSNAQVRRYFSDPKALNRYLLELARELESEGSVLPKATRPGLR